MDSTWNLYPEYEYALPTTSQLWQHKISLKQGRKLMLSLVPNVSKTASTCTTENIYFYLPGAIFPIEIHTWVTKFLAHK